MGYLIPKTDFHAWVRTTFPNMSPEHCRLTSPIASEYNCIAWAAGDVRNWWWPDEDGYWPAHLPLVDTLDNFVAAFQEQGYESSDGGILEPGFEKVAIYTGALGRVKHMARQLPDGIWTSKLGAAWDIEHRTATELECDLYGTVAQYLRRALAEQI